MSLRQHRYWRLICKYVERETGNDAAEFHTFIKNKFATRTMTIGNKVYEDIPSMGAMSMDEARDMIDKGILFIESKFGIECPRPNRVPIEFITQYGGNVNDFY